MFYQMHFLSNIKQVIHTKTNAFMRNDELILLSFSLIFV